MRVFIFLMAYYKIKDELKRDGMKFKERVLAYEGKFKDTDEFLN